MELATIRELQHGLRVQCEGLDPDAVPLLEVVPLFGELERIAKLVAGAKLRLVRKLDEAGAAGTNGHRDTPDFLSRNTGTSAGAARDALDASRRLGCQPDLDRALAKGEISEEQARAVSDAASADPDAEKELVNTAKRRSVRDLKRKCADTKAKAHPDAAARREAIRRARNLRTWTDREGAWNLSMRHLPEVGAEIEALLAPYTQARFDAARKAGEREPHQAYRADALLDLARASTPRSDAAATPGCGAPKGARRADTKVFVHIDLDTLLRGGTRRGSICHIDGIGPIDVEHVRALLGEAFVVALVNDGCGVRSVVHLGRQVTAHQRSALEARGHQCEVPGCDVTWGLEIDHITGWAISGTTVLDDLAWQCAHHHDQKTHRGYRLSGPHGARVWTAPDGARRYDQPPPDPPREHGAPDEPRLFATASVGCR